MSKEAILGLFVLVVFAVFLVFTINMGSGLFAGRKVHYPVYFTHIGTLDKGAPVKQAGVNIGEVDSIASKIIMEPTPTYYVVVDVNVNEKAHVSWDSEASVYTLGMMGEQYIELSYGDLENAPEGTRLEGHGPQQMDQVISEMNLLIQDVRKITLALGKVLGNTAFQQNITKLTENLKKISEEINDFLGGEEDRLKDIMENAQIASANLISLIATSELFVTDARSMINDNSVYLNETLKNSSKLTKALSSELPENLNNITSQISTLSEQLNKSMKNADRLIVKLNDIVDDNNPEIEKSMENLMEFTENAKHASNRVNSFLHQIESGDSIVHDLIYDPELSLSAKHTIAQASNVLGNVTNLGDRFSWELDMLYFPDSPRFDIDDNNARVDFSLRYAMYDDLYLQLGGNNLGSSNDFEAQIGYQAGPVTFHGGIIESELGLGIDWQLFDRWMIGMEGVGLTDNNEERLDAYSEFLIWKNFYLYGGAQDITDDLFPHVGLRLKF